MLRGSSPGDSVNADEVIAQIETDKVTIDVRAPSPGVVKALEVMPEIYNTSTRCTF